MKIFAVAAVCLAGAIAQSPKAALSTNVASALKAETLHYGINWQSGLSLGEGTITSAPGKEDLTFRMNVQASLPGFALDEKATAKSALGFCSASLEKEWTRGKRKGQETTTFDPTHLVAKRKTKGGGESDISISQCGRDALTYFFFVRRELAAGRLPATQQVLYGAPYQSSLQYKGAQSIRVGDEMIQTDHLDAKIKGPASEFTLEMYFARDAVRTPLRVLIPTSLGKFSVELLREQ